MPKMLIFTDWENVKKESLQKLSKSNFFQQYETSG